MFEGVSPAPAGGARPLANRSLHLLILDPRPHYLDPVRRQDRFRLVRRVSLNANRIREARTLMSEIRKVGPPGAARNRRHLGAAEKSTRRAAGHRAKTCRLPWRGKRTPCIQSESHWHLSCSSFLSNKHDVVSRGGVGFRMSSRVAGPIGRPGRTRSTASPDPNFSRHSKHNHRQREEPPKGSIRLPKDNIEDKRVTKYVRLSSPVMERVGYYDYESGILSVFLDG